MGDRETHTQNQPQTTPRLGLRNSGGGGEIVEVQGGHIVRSTGRKDRHSKVCTAKGPRDRRVRLSAHTAIQFYDVQDRLGYDRPSKAVDWLIKKAKSAIDELDELPPWHPTTTTITSTTSNAANVRANDEDQQQILQGHVVDIMGGSSSGSRRGALLMSGDKGNVYSMQYPQDRVEDGQGNENASNAAFLPASLDSDSIADTIKSFFPVGGASAEANSGFQNYPPDLLSRTSSNNQNNSSQDLRLSLQSLQDPMLMQSHQQHQHSGPTHQAIFSGNNPVGFDGVASTGGWSDHASDDFGRMQRMIAWNAAGRDSSASGGNGGFMFNPLSPQTLSQPSLQPLFGQSGQFYSQRGPLQSSNTPTIRCWIDQPIQDHAQHHHQAPSIHHSYGISGIGGSSASGGFSGFRVPTRVHGEDEEHDGMSNKPSSASSDSRH